MKSSEPHKTTSFLTPNFPSVFQSLKKSPIMICDKLTLSVMAIVVAMVLVCHQTSAATSVVSPVVNGTSNGTLVNKPAVPVVVAPAVASNIGKTNCKYKKPKMGLELNICFLYIF